MKNTAGARDVLTLDYLCTICQWQATVEFAPKLAPGKFVVNEGRWRAECPHCGAHTVGSKRCFDLRGLDMIDSAGTML